MKLTELDHAGRPREMGRVSGDVLSEQQSAPSPVETAAEAPSNRPLIIGVLVVLFLALFGAGWMVGTREVTLLEEELASVRTEAAEAAEAAQREVDAAEVTLEAASLRNRLLEGRRALARAEVAILDENFGVARSHMTAAITTFADAPQPFPPLAEQARNIEIASTGDGEATRNAIRSVAILVDAAIDAEP